jgi:hypothetical protein
LKKRHLGRKANYKNSFKGEKRTAQGQIKEQKEEKEGKTKREAVLFKSKRELRCT